ncbi:MAG: Hint domain-containing protein [Actinomycetota bacterium]
MWPRSGPRVGAFVLLAWLVWLPLVVSISPSAAQSGSGSVVGTPCDADRDGAADGRRAEWTTNGADDTADTLAEEAGRTLSTSRAGFRWSVPVCVEYEPGGSLSVRVVGVITEVQAAQAAAWENAALARAIDEIEAATPPTPVLSPPIDEPQVVGLETWLAVDPATFVEVTAAATVGEVRVSVTAEPVGVRWTFSDGEWVCDGPGTPYTPDADGPAPCGRDWEHTTRVAPMVMEARIIYDVAWSSTLANAGATTVDGRSSGRVDLTVGEIQSVGVVGERTPPAGGGYSPDGVLDDRTCSLIALLSGPCAPIAEAPEWPAWPDLGDGDGCEAWRIVRLGWPPVGWGEIEDCTRIAIDWAGQAAQWIGEQALDAYAALPGPHKQALDLIFNALRGCGDVAVDAVKGVWTMFEAALQAGREPVEFVQEQFDTLNELRAAIATDPSEFAAEFLGELVDAQLLADNPARWVGKLGCELAVAFFTGGVAASTGRAAKLLTKIDDIKHWRTTRHNTPSADSDTPDRDTPAVACGLNSFPTNTPVAMADGTRKPIQDVQPGDQVLAYDLDTGHWQPDTVTAAWTHPDHGHLVTATLTNGTTITATDHHHFWVHNRSTWLKLDQLRPGDTFHTPTGPVDIKALTIHPRATTTVHELDTKLTDTYTTHTGTHDLLVHNAEGCFETDKNSRQTRTLSDGELDHGFDRHAAEIFGTQVRRSTHFQRFREIVEAAQRSNLTFENRRGGQATIAHLARVEIDGELRYVVLDFFADGDRAGQVATITRPSEEQLARYLEAASRNGP